MRLSQKGFSLVELMVVVAIIGILAAIAVPNFQRFSAKAKQSEAKANLAAIYGAEKAFIGEWQTYDADMLAIGYKPEGFLKYRLTNGALVTVPANYTGPVPNAANNVTSAVCGANAIGGSSGTCGEILSNGIGVAAPVGGAIAMTANAFSSQASSILFSGGTADTWQIDNFKQVTNPTSGLP